MNTRKARILTVRLLAATLLTAGSLAGSNPAAASQGTVFVTNPMPPDIDNINNNFCSLRSAIIYENSGNTYYDGCQELPNSSGTKTIVLPPGTYTLKDVLPTIYSDELKYLTISGSGYARTFIDGAGAASYGPVTLGFGYVMLANLSFQNFQPGALHVDSGTIANVDYVQFINNGVTLASTGAAITNEGSMGLFRVDITAQQSAFQGHIFNTGSLAADGLSIHRAVGHQGIVNNYGGYMTLVNTTLGANSTGAAGSVLNADYNGNTGNVNIYNSTIAYNTTNAVGVGDAIMNISSSGSVTVTDSLIYGNGNESPTCSGANIVSYGHNVFDKHSVCTAMVAGDSAAVDPGVDKGTNQAPNFHGGVGPVYLPNSTSSALLGHADGAGTSYDGRGAFRDLTHAAVGAVQPSSAALVVHSSSSLTSGDKAVKAAMDVVFGAPFYSVQSDTWAGTVANNGAIVIAGSTNSTNVGAHFTNSASDVVVLNPSAYRSMNMANSTGTANTNTLTNQHWFSNILTGAPSSPETGSTGFVDGTVDPAFPYPNNEPVLTNSNVLFGWGTPFVLNDTNDLRIPATTNKDGLFGYLTQAQMFNNFHAPAWRWGVFADDAAAAALSPAGTRLLQEVLVAATNPGH